MQHTNTQQNPAEGEAKPVFIRLTSYFLSFFKSSNSQQTLPSCVLFLYQDWSALASAECGETIPLLSIFNRTTLNLNRQDLIAYFAKVFQNPWAKTDAAKTAHSLSGDRRYMLLPWVVWKQRLHAYEAYAPAVNEEKLSIVGSQFYEIKSMA